MEELRTVTMDIDLANEIGWIPFKTQLPAAAGFHLATWLDESSNTNKVFPAYFDFEQQRFYVVVFQYKELKLYTADNPVAWKPYGSIEPYKVD